MTDFPNRRVSDEQIRQLIDRVNVLDDDVKQLRQDFDDHTTSEATKIEMLNASLVTIQVKLDQLLLDINPVVEVYKSAKAGWSFMKFISETAKWLVPLIVGLWLGFGGIKVIEQPQVEKPKVERSINGS